MVCRIFQHDEIKYFRFLNCLSLYMIYRSCPPEKYAPAMLVACSRPTVPSPNARIVGHFDMNVYYYILVSVTIFV